MSVWGAAACRREMKTVAITATAKASGTASRGWPSKGTAEPKLLLQSWTSSDSPFVRIAFAQGDTRYEIQKQFLKGASAQLSGGGTTLRGEDAEEALRTLLGAQQYGTDHCRVRSGT